MFNLSSIVNLNIDTLLIDIGALKAHIFRDKSLLTLSKGLEDIQRGHKKFRAVKGGPLKP